MELNGPGPLRRSVAHPDDLGRWSADHFRSDSFSSGTNLDQRKPGSRALWSSIIPNLARTSLPNVQRRMVQVVPTEIHGGLE